MAHREKTTQRFTRTTLLSRACLYVCLSLLLLTGVSAQTITVFDTVFVPPGYTTGGPYATMHVPTLGNGIGVVVLHGGGADRSSVHLWCDTLAAHGYVAMAIDYPDAGVYPTGGRALKLATEFLRRNAQRFGVTTGKVAAVGFSDGAITLGRAIIWNNDDAYFQTDPLVDDRLDAAALFYGFYNPETEPLISWPIFWTVFQNDSARALKGTATKHIGNISTPVLLLHGTTDNICSFGQSVELNDSLLARGKISQLVAFPGSAHGFDNYPGGGLFTPAGLIAKDSVFAFLRRTVAPALKIRISNTLVDFEALPSSGTRTMSVKIENIGATNLRLDGLTGLGPAFTLDNPPAFPSSIAPLGSILLNISFHPSAHGTINDTLVVASDDTLHPFVGIALRGKGIAAPVGSAKAGVLYVTSAGTPGGQSYTMNTSTGVLTPIGSLGIPEITASAVRASDRALFGVHATATGASVYRICSDSGYAVYAGALSVGNLSAVAFGAGDTLYGATPAGTLYRVDLLTGQGLLLGTSAGLKYSGLAYKTGRNQLWASVRYPIDSIFTLNTGTGAPTFVGTTGFSALTSSITFGPDGSFWGLIDNGSGEYYIATLDTNGGPGSVVAGPLGAQYLRSIVFGPGTVTSVTEHPDAGVPMRYALGQNYPNPFNPGTTIRYALPMAVRVTLTIFNTLGQEVATLIRGDQEAGYHEVRFEAAHLSSGVYFYRLQAGEFTQTRKLLLLR